MTNKDECRETILSIMRKTGIIGRKAIINDQLVNLILDAYESYPSPTIQTTPVCGDALVDKMELDHVLGCLGIIRKTAESAERAIKAMAGCFDTVPPAASMGDAFGGANCPDSKDGSIPSSPTTSRDDWQRVMDALKVAASPLCPNGVSPDYTPTYGEVVDDLVKRTASARNAYSICERNLKGE